MAISKRLRFEILRRDGHKCRYCGAGAPDVQLRVDHVVPDALGGKTEPGNLVTACEPCNNGKSSVVLDGPVVDDVERDAFRWARAIQAAALSYELELLERTEQDRDFRAMWDAWSVAGDKVPLPDDWEQSVRRLRAAGLTNTLLAESIESSMRASGVRIENHFRYFCGVAWRMVTALQERARATVGADHPEERPAVTTETLERHIADALDHAGARFDPWVYDEFVLDLAGRLRGEV